jgi:hypothetical protein
MRDLHPRQSLNFACHRPDSQFSVFDRSIRSKNRTPFAAIGSILALALLLVGCGGSSEPTASRPPADAPAGEEAASGETISQTETTAVVSQFLDRMRRGGGDKNANELLTKLAQQEMIRIGYPLQLPGSPDTKYDVLSAYPIPDQPGQVWVHTVLSEPTAEGQPLQYEVVWTLKQDQGDWRISGFTIDQGEDLEPLNFDFENGDQMKAQLAGIMPDESDSEQPVQR